MSSGIASQPSLETSCWVAAGRRDTTGSVTVLSLERSPHSWQAHRPTPNCKLSNVVRCVADKYLRQCVTDRWKDGTVCFIGKWLIQSSVIQLIDGSGDSTLGIAEQSQSIVFRFVQAGISDRHTARAEALGPVVGQPSSESDGTAQHLARGRKMTDDPSRVIHEPVWLRDHVRSGNVSNLFAEEVEAVGKTVRDRFHSHSLHPFGWRTIPGSAGMAT